MRKDNIYTCNVSSSNFSTKGEKLYRERILFGILLFFFGFSFAQNPIETVADTTKIRIGEQIEYKISVDKQENVIFPKLVLDSLGKVEVVEALKIDTTETKYIKKYLLTSFDSGRYVIPSQQVFINTKKHLTDSLLIDVATVKVDTIKQKLFPIKAVKNQPIIFDDYKFYLWIGLAILALILALIWYFFIRKEKEEEVIENKIPPYQMAVERLSALDSKMLWQKDKIKLYYIELTDILRSYVESEYKIPALESTTDELIETIKDFNKISTIDFPKTTIKDLQKLLREADLVKFAKFKPMSTEIELHRTDAENIINNLKPEEIEIIDSNDVVLSETALEDSSKKKWSTKRIVVLSIIIIALLGAITVGTYVYKGFKFAKENIIGDSTKNLLEGEWNSGTYGYPSISIESPRILKAQEVKLPSQLRNMIDEMANFVYQSPINAFQIMVSTGSYTSQVKEFNIDGAAGMIIQQMKARGIEFSSIDKEPIFIRDNEGLKVTATYEDENPITKKKQENQAIIVVYGSVKGTKSVLINYLKEDVYGKQVAERIINSIDIEDETVE